MYDYYVISALLGLMVTYLLYRISTKNHSFWKDRNVPFVKPYPFVGSLAEDFGKLKMEDLDIERRKKFGNIYGFFEATQPGIFIGDPILLRNILVKDFHYFANRRLRDLGDPAINNMLQALQSEDWKRVRSIVSPTFSTGKIKRVLGIFQDCSKTLTKNFKEVAEKGESIDVSKIYGAFTMDVIASSAFSTKIDSHNDPENIFVRRAKEMFSPNVGIRFILLFLFPRIMKILNFTPFSREMVEFFRKIPLEMIKERKRTGQTRNDFLQLLIDSANEIVDEEIIEENTEDIAQNYKDESTTHPVFRSNHTKHISKDELVAQCLIFFLAGYHTTSITLAVTTYLLAVNQDIQDKLFQEIKETLHETDGVLNYESIQKMKYLDNVISETLRMYPPILRLERVAQADYQLGDTGITIPKDMQVLIPIFAMQRDANFFPEPEKFNPERFRPGEREKLEPYTYMPFGFGPRNCVAMRFALMEMKVCLIHVLSTFHVIKSKDTKVPLELEKGIGVLRPKPVLLCLDSRENCPLKI